MRRIVSSDAVCLHTTSVRESSRLVTLFTPDHGRVVCLAKGARRPRSRFGAALDRCAVARVIYYWRESRTTYTLTDAALVRSTAGLSRIPGRFLAAEQMTEFVLRATALHDPHPPLYQLLLAYFAALEQTGDGFPLLVSSFLLKAASFLGFRPELHRCLVCHKDMTVTPGDSDCGARPLPRSGVLFHPARGGVICQSCAGVTSEQGMTEVRDRVPSFQLLAPGELAQLQRLLYTPADKLVGDSGHANLDLALDFLAHHFDPLMLNSIRWPDGL
jgi:DNA repair protein RecO (recombination protein O)